MDLLSAPLLSEGLDLATFAISPVFTLLRRGADLLMVQLGWRDPGDASRLGAYQATLGHDRQTVGRGANNSIGGIYMLLGKFGQDKIGDVFFSEKAQATLADPVDSPSNRKLAQVEYDYWHSQWEKDRTAGGFLGTKVSPEARGRLQSWLSRF